MEYYSIIFVLFLLGFTIKPYRSFAYYLAIGVMIVLVALRSGNGQDYESYRSIYLGVRQSFGSLELGFVWLVKFCRLLGLSFEGFSFIISLATFFYVNKTIKALSNSDFQKLFFLFGYFCLFYFTHQFNLIRNGFAVSASVYGYICLMRKNRVGWLHIVIGILMHTVALWVVLVVVFDKLIDRLAINPKRIIIVIFIGAAFVYFNIHMVILDLFAEQSSKVAYYLHEYHKNIGRSSVVSYGYTYGLIVNVIIAWYFIYVRKMNFELRNLLIASFFFAFVFNPFGVFVERIYLYGTYVMLFLVVDFAFSYRGALEKVMAKLVLVTYFLILLAVVFQTKDVDGNLTYLNYKSEVLY